MPFNSNSEQLDNQREILKKLDGLQGDFRLISADVQGIKQSLNEHKQETGSKITEQDKNIDSLKAEQVRTQTALTTLRMAMGACAVVVMPIAGWYLSNVNTSVNSTSQIALNNQQKIENIQKIQDERKVMITSLDERLGRMKDELIQYRKEDNRSDAIKR